MSRAERFAPIAGVSGRIGVALLVGLTVTVSGCQRPSGGDAVTAQTAPVEKRACVAAEPAQWAESIAGSAVDTGAGTTRARAVSPAGEIIAVRDTGTSRELLLIGVDRSVRDLYTLPESDEFVFGYVGIDDRWIVFAVEHLPRNANGVLPQVRRIEVIDRQTGARRTVAEHSAADAAAVPERNVPDSVVLADGTVYWITRDTYNGQTGAVHSFDPLTDTRADLASGPLRDLQAGPLGNAGATASATLPPAVSSLPSDDAASLGTDGTAYGWISGSALGGTAIGYFSAQTGVVKVNDVDVDAAKFRSPVLVFDSYVILDAGGSTTALGTSAVVVDTRSGAVVTLTAREPGQYDTVAASMGGTLALNLWKGPGRETKQADYAVGLLRSNGLAAPTC